jgi:hypothetical protein
VAKNLEKLAINILWELIFLKVRLFQIEMGLGKY